MTINTLFLVNFASCLMMTGLIWLIQVVHYPSFHYIASERFKAFENFHAKSITFIVFPLMLAELVTSILITLNSVTTFNIINLISVLLLWLMTLIVSMPKHKRLSNGYDKQTINSLNLTNWPRTIIWSLRSLALSSILLSQI